MDSFEREYCHICKRHLVGGSKVTTHLRKHSITQKDYYTKYYPRFDKFNHEPIVFKSVEQYFATDFNTKANFKSWLLAAPKDEAADYMDGLLVRRKNVRKMLFAPSQVELKSLGWPGINYLNGLFGSYYEHCAKLGFRLKQRNLASLNDVFVPFKSDHKILVDTREQLPLNFSCATESVGLPFGDYKLNDDSFTGQCCIERKSLQDFYGTLSHGFERFCKEIDKARQAGFYMVILVESPMEYVYGHNEKLRAMNITISPEYIMHNMRYLCQKYPMVQFLFVKDRKEASKAIEKIFQSGGTYKLCDLQLLYDMGKLI